MAKDNKNPKSEEKKKNVRLQVTKLAVIDPAKLQSVLGGRECPQCSQSGCADGSATNCGYSN